MKTTPSVLSRLFLLLALVPWLMGGCQTVYYNTMEKLGTHKREILVDRIEEARDSQTEAKEQFKDALEQFTVVMNFKGGELEDKYNKINAAYEDSEERAEEVHDRIEKVEHVAGALFDEWQDEIEQFTSAKLKRNSQEKLRVTQRRYNKLIGAMKRAEKKIEPVLSSFKNQVLTLKHNLNAAAIASLQNELVAVETDVQKLIQEMEKSIAEADAFINSMEAENVS